MSPVYFYVKYSQNNYFLLIMTVLKTGIAKLQSHVVYS